MTHRRRVGAGTGWDALPPATPLSVRAAVLSRGRIAKALALHPWNAGGAGRLYFKQTFVAAAGVAPLAIVVRRPPQAVRRFAFSLIPLASVIVAFVLTKLMAPVMFYYMVETSKLYPIRFSRVIVALVSMASFCPIFYILAVGYAPQSTARS